MRCVECKQTVTYLLGEFQCPAHRDICAARPVRSSIVLRDASRLIDEDELWEAAQVLRGVVTDLEKAHVRRATEKGSRGVS